jgi:protein TonB
MRLGAPHWRWSAFAITTAMAIVGASVGLVAAQPAGPSAVGMIDGPIDPMTAKWRRLPAIDDLARAYPAKAMENGVGGEVLMHCRVTPAGGMADCSIVSETPSGYGFGAAALSLAPFCHLRGGPYGSNASVEIPIRFFHTP